MKDIAIIGAGGFGREVKTLIDTINKVENKYNFLGYFDDALPQGTIINDYPVLGNLDALESYANSISIALGIGNPVTKKQIVSKLSNKNIEYPTLIHPSVIISNDKITIDQGCILCAGSIITCNIAIGKFVTLNLMCTIGHDTIIDDYCSFMPSVNISGEVLVKESVYVGTGAKIINQLCIEENTIVGAGAVVSKSLPPNCTAVGIPAKPIKFHSNEQ